MDDSTLISRLLEGDSEAVETLRAWVRLSFYPYRARLAAELEDLEQDALLDLTRALRREEFRGQCSLRTFAKKFGHYKCIDRLRALNRRHWVDLEHQELVEPAPSALDALEKSEAFERAQQVLLELDEPCRQLLERVWRGTPYRQLSRELGIAEGALRARVLRCRRRAVALAEKNSKKVRNKPAAATTG